jgi:transposase-like protein
VADGDARAELLKLGVRKIVEEALEAEVADAVGRDYYENGAAPGAGYRNGYRRGRLRTAEGPIEYGVPQVADRAEPFVSRVRARLAGRTAELERLAIEMFARGLSTRDIEAAFRDDTGTSVLSRTAVSQVTERLWQEYEAFVTRDLSEFQVAYLFVDGVAERLHAGMPREAVLCAWGITEDGRKVLLHLAPGTKEDTASCTAFFEDLKRRELPDPLLAVTDGAPGLIRGVETCFPRALRQRCLVHRRRNLQSKAPETQWPEIAIRARACYEAASPALATLLRDDFVHAYERELPALVKCFPRGFRGLDRASALPASASEGHSDHESPRAALPRGAPLDQGDPACLPGAARAQADVRGDHPRGGSVARDQGRGVRAAAAARDSRRTHPRSRRADRARRGGDETHRGAQTEELRCDRF